ncbi:unnamed protein product [Paramecium primaurelia]|uniref:Uncharacterized protein n=1 Tax=Paramecium primaurelia TaxID=5886 RepID=A0A8S1KKJ5_PARPR|nr:unnamed protein product [Paramecium primaurelia]
MANYLQQQQLMVNCHPKLLTVNNLQQLLQLMDNYHQLQPRPMDNYHQMHMVK